MLPSLSGCCTLCLVLSITVSWASFTEKIPIGAIFDIRHDDDIRLAFSYEVASFNKRQNRIKLSPEIIPLNTDDSYAVGSAICQLMSNGIVTLFASHSVSTLTTIRSYSATFQLPFVTSNMAVNVSRAQPNLGYELYLRPHYSRAVVDLVRHYGWREIWCLYSSDEGLERLQQLLDTITDAGLVVRQLIYRVLDARDADRTLRRLDYGDDGAKHVIVDLPTKQCEEFLRIQKNDTRGIFNHYLIMGLGVSEMDQNIFIPGGNNITGFRIVDHMNLTVRKFLDDGWYSQTRHRRVSNEAAMTVDAVTVIGNAIIRLMNFQPSVLKHALRNGKLYNNGSEGLDCEADPVIPWRHGYELIKAMKETEHAGLTGTVRFNKYGQRVHYKLDVMEASLNPELQKVGWWQSNRGLFIQPPIIRPKKTFNGVINRTLVITSMLGPPYLITKPHPLNGPKRTGNDLYEGYCADLARMIAEQVGFSYVIRPVLDGKYGKKENNSWNGIVGELVRREADMAIAPLTITANREKVIYFSKPFMSLGISIMIKKPVKETPSVFSFMNPLSYEIWMCILFAYIGVSVVLFLVSRFSPYEWHIEDHNDGPTISNNFTIFNSLWFTIGAFMQQGCDIEPRSVSGRIVGSVWWFFTLIIISSYTANLAAFLTVERMQSPIESAEDLAKQTEIKYGTIDSGSTREFFEASTIPVYERMWAFMTTTGRSAFVSSIEEGVKRVRQGKYAFLIESTTNDYINQRQPCDTMKVGSNLDSKGYGIATPLSSDLRDRITLAVLEMSEKEELANLEKNWWYDKGECPDRTYKKQELTSSLKLSHVAGLFYILLCGIALAVLTAACEFLYKTKIEAAYRKTTFVKAIRSKARLSLTGTPECQSLTMACPPMAHLVNLDDFADNDNMQTQV